MCALYVISIPTETYAFNSFYSDNDILFYDKSATTSCDNTSLTLSGKDNRQKIYNFLTGKGLNSQQAAGVLGNIQNESGFSPTRHEQGKDFSSGGYGIAQWTFGRRTTLEQYLDQTIPDLMSKYYNDTYGGAVTEADGFVPKNATTGELMPTTDNDSFLSAELSFLFDETSSRIITAKTSSVTSAKQGDNEWDALKNATGIEDAVNIWLYNFEIPANIEQATVARADSAQDILATLSSESTDGSSDSSCANATSGSVAALQATIKSYAWPSYLGSGYKTRKPEYITAVEKAQAIGGYVGGYDGVDCGGFVTRAMIDSGYEPNYNYANASSTGDTKDRPGYTGVQKQWLDANWSVLGTGSTIDITTLKPGDVAMKPGHTFLFAGTNIDGFGTDKGWKGIASASENDRAPMAGFESITDSSVTWYRKKAVSNE